MKRIRFGLMLLLPLLSGAGAAADPQSLLRAGDAAASRSDFEAAADNFAKALERTNDPAPAAFNLAVAHLHLAGAGQPADRNRELHEAELLFASFTGESTKGDPDSRRTLALYGLGVCRLLRAEGGDVEAARAAIHCLRECLQDDAIEPALRADARHNLARARLLAWQLTTPPPAGGDKSEPQGDNKDNSQQPQDPNDPNTKTSSSDKQDPKPGDPTRMPEDGSDPKKTDRRNQHGNSGPPALPDNTTPTPLSPGDAVIYLERASRALRTEREQQHRQQAAAAAPPGVRDW